jgi:hypothetical protein
MTTSFDQLPTEVQFQVLIDLGYPELNSLCQVSSVAQQLCDDDYLWRQLWQKDFPLLPRRRQSALADYLRVWNELWSMANTFTVNQSRANRRLVDVNNQVQLVFNIIKAYLHLLEPDEVRSWIEWNRLVDSGEAEECGGIHGCEVLGMSGFGDPITELAHDLLWIMLPLDSRTLHLVTHNLDWESTLQEYENFIEPWIRRIIMGRDIGEIASSQT